MSENLLPQQRYDWDEMVTNLFDLLSDNPDGVELTTISERLECDIRVARMAITKLRAELSESAVNVVARPDGRVRKYVLLGQGDTAEMDTDYLRFNRKYVETRLSTVRVVYQSLQRSAETERLADKYRRALKTLDRLIEDVADIDSD